MSYRLTTLRNGLRVVTVPLHDTQAVTVFVFTKVGSRYETRPLSGSTHFIEHLMFKGTTRRPSAMTITRLLDGVGASYNAFTSKDCTGYYVKVNAEHAELAVDILADIVQHSSFAPKEIARERGVILEEINMYADNPLLSIDDLFEETMFGSHHPLGWNILGPKKNISGMSRAQLVRYRDRYYRAGNMFVVVAGRGLDHIAPHIQRHFGSVRPGRAAARFRPYRPAVGQPMVRLESRPVEQVQVALGVRGLPYHHPQLAALSVLGNILGGTMSSRLFLEVREKRGLAYNISAGATSYEDTGMFSVHAGLDKTKLEDALRVIVAELRRLKQTTVTAAELRRGKENLRGRTILELEDSDALASWYGRQVLFGKKIKSPDEALAKIAKVTAADIQAVATKLFRPAAMHLAVIGPFRQTESWQKILRGV